MKFHATALAVAALITVPGLASATNTINFSGNVIDQTCSVLIEGSTDPIVTLNNVPASALNGSIGRTAGDTTFTMKLTGCAAPSKTAERFSTMFQAINPTSAGNLSNTAVSGATGVALQLLDAPAGKPVKLASGAAVEAGEIVLANGQTSTSYDYAVRYVSEAAAITAGPVLGSVTYTLHYK